MIRLKVRYTFCVLLLVISQYSKSVVGYDVQRANHDFAGRVDEQSSRNLKDGARRRGVDSPMSHARTRVGGVSSIPRVSGNTHGTRERNKGETMVPVLAGMGLTAAGAVALILLLNNGSDIFSDISSTVSDAVNDVADQIGDVFDDISDAIDPPNLTDVLDDLGLSEVSELLTIPEIEDFFGEGLSDIVDEISNTITDISEIQCLDDLLDLFS